jgi:threonine dehydrogenase-like Zn-dependent dehydrogenase
MVGRGGTISLSGVCGGTADPLPMMVLFDKQIQLRMDQANVRRWVDDILPLLTGDNDPLGVETFATHRLPIDDAPRHTRTSRGRSNPPSRSCSSPNRTAARVFDICPVSVACEAELLLSLTR